MRPTGTVILAEVKDYLRKIRSEVVKIFPDGSIWLNQKYFNYATGLTMTKDNQWENLFGLKRRNADDELSEEHCNLALAIQIVAEEVILLMAQEAKRLTGEENICFAGGVALNCVANGKLQELGII